MCELKLARTSPIGFGSARFALRASVGVLVLVAAGCQQKMASQPSYKPLTTAEFFQDNRTARHLPPGTVARGHLRVDRPLFTGRREPGDVAQIEDEGLRRAEREGVRSIEREGGWSIQPGQPNEQRFLERFPFPVTEEVLRHGRNRYTIYCVMCHDPLGTGRGKIVERGFTKPPSYHIERLRESPPGRLFAVITEGFGAMPAYRKQIPPRDRWAIVAYVRALQLSQRFPRERLTDSMREELAQAASRAAASAREGQRDRDGVRQIEAQSSQN